MVDEHQVLAVGARVAECLQRGARRPEVAGDERRRVEDDVEDAQVAVGVVHEPDPAHAGRLGRALPEHSVGVDRPGRDRGLRRRVAVGRVRRAHVHHLDALAGRAVAGARDLLRRVSGEARGAGQRGGDLGGRRLGVGPVGEHAAGRHLVGGGDGTGGRDGGEGQDGRHGCADAEHGGLPRGRMSGVEGSDPRPGAEVGRLRVGVGVPARDPLAGTPTLRGRVLVCRRR